MSASLRLAAVVLLLVTCAASAVAQTAAPVSPPTAVRLTVYNDNFALVTEDRYVKLAEGMNIAKVAGVPAKIQPTSVSLVSLTAPQAVSVREQNYQYDLITPENVLGKAVGKPIRVLVQDATGPRAIEGTLLNVEHIAPDYGTAGQTGLVVRTSQGLSVLTDSTQGVIVDLGPEALSEGMISQPQLLWKLNAARGGDHRCRLSYLTAGISWSADYVAVVNAKDDALDLNAWVTLTNNSGATYRDASLQLMAGEVRRIPALKPPVARRRAGRSPVAAAPPAFAEQPFFEYHLYTLDGTTTIADQETKQMTLLAGHAVPVSKTYVYDARRGPAVAVTLEVVNSTKNRLGVPLPKGRVRVYKADDRGRAQFVGEDSINHTPRDERVKLSIGNAFDITAGRRQTAYRVLPRRQCEVGYKIALRNHKNAPVAVKAVEHLPGGWTMLSSSHAFKQRDAGTIEFTVRVPAGKQAVVAYRAKVTG